MLHEPQAPLRLLAVEDDPTDRSWLDLMLSDATFCEHSLNVVATMAEAESALAFGAFDCVLLDLSLPDCDGIETVARVLGVDADLPIVVFTGTNETGLGLRAIEAGAQDFLVKGHASGDTILQSARWAVARVQARRKVVVGTIDAPVLDRVPECWAFLGLDLAVLRANPALCATVGIDADAIAGVKFTTLADDASQGPLLHAFRSLVTGESGSFALPIVLLGAGGSWHPRTVVGLSVDPAGGQDGWVLVILARAPDPG